MGGADEHVWILSGVGGNPLILQGDEMDRVDTDKEGHHEAD